MSLRLVGSDEALAELEEAMKIRSNAFEVGKSIPRRHTCDGEDVSPPLEWSGVPAAARSLVLLCDDPDAPAGTWHHWAVYDIPADWSSLSEGASRESNLTQAVNDFGRPGYGGPCPPLGHGTHHYHFRLLALSVERLPFLGMPSCVDIEREARNHVLAEAMVIGTYAR
jgi:Raf kinase inhibitor-like YbhB/YbcL family protein